MLHVGLGAFHGHHIDMYISYCPVILYDLAHRTFTVPSSWRHTMNKKKAFSNIFTTDTRSWSTGLRSDSIKNHASRNKARRLTCIYLTAMWRHVLLVPSYLRLLGGECVSVDVESCSCISNLRFNLYGLAYSAFFCFLTCDKYKSSLRHIHDPVLSSLKMKGIRLPFFTH
jgi:hypothetical protein